MSKIITGFIVVSTFFLIFFVPRGKFFQLTDLLSSTFYSDKVYSLIIGRSEVDSVKKALSEKANSDLVIFEEDKPYVLISNIYNNADGHYLAGTIRVDSKNNHYYWVAAKSEGGWTILYFDKNYPLCRSIGQNLIPKTLIKCID